MASKENITMTLREYDAPIEHDSQLEDMLAAQDADDGMVSLRKVALNIRRIPSWHFSHLPMEVHEYTGDSDAHGYSDS